MIIITVFFYLFLMQITMQTFVYLLHEYKIMKQTALLFRGHYVTGHYQST